MFGIYPLPILLFIMEHQILRMNRTPLPFCVSFESGSFLERLLRYFLNSFPNSLFYFFFSRGIPFPPLVTDQPPFFLFSANRARRSFPCPVSPFQKRTRRCPLSLRDLRKIFLHPIISLFFPPFSEILFSPRHLQSMAFFFLFSPRIRTSEPSLPSGVRCLSPPYREQDGWISLSPLK